jgi:ubiquinone/menaquinone biosynthesis C-methylase UbiE
VVVFQQLMQQAFKNRQYPSVGLWGVTPELVNLNWPNETHLSAFDISERMIESHWKAPALIDSQVAAADWCDLPVEDAYFDFMLGDGVFTAIESRDKLDAMLKEAKRVLKPQGRIAVRTFIRPDHYESHIDIQKEALSGSIENFGTLKFRLAMAITDSHTSQVAPLDVLHLFNELFPNRDELASYTGWSIEQINTIDAYLEHSGRLYFPNLSGLMASLSGFFTVVSLEYGQYELSRCCPIFFLKPMRIGELNNFGGLLCD